MKPFILMLLVSATIPNLTEAQWNYVTMIIPPTPGHESPLPVEVVGRTNELAVASNELATLVSYSQGIDESPIQTEFARLDFTKDGVTVPSREAGPVASLVSEAWPDFKSVVVTGPATIRLLRQSGQGSSLGTAGTLATWRISRIATPGRFLTLVIPPNSNRTNEFPIPANQIARLLSFPFNASRGGVMELSKDLAVLRITPRTWFGVFPGTKDGEVIVAGPATVRLSVNLSDRPDYGSFCTWEILPIESDANRFLSVPNNGAVNVEMQSSTNLVNWGAATNGVYGSGLDTRFFRLSAEKTN